MNLVELAERLRKLRQERGYSIEETASRAGLTRSWLSKVESFRVTPSLPSLGRLAEVLDVRLAELVAGLDEKPRLTIVRPAQRHPIQRDAEASTIRYELLAHARPRRRMDPLFLTVPPHGGRKEQMIHPGEEFLFVLSGKTDFEFDGQLHALEAGDALYFDAAAPHRLFNPHNEPATVLCVFYGLDESL